MEVAAAVEVAVGEEMEALVDVGTLVEANAAERGSEGTRGSSKWGISAIGGVESSPEGETMVTSLEGGSMLGCDWRTPRTCEAGRCESGVKKTNQPRINFKSLNQ